MADESSYGGRAWRRQVSRRRLIQGAALTGAGLLMAPAFGCGSGSQQAGTASKQATAAAPAAAASGSLEEKLYAAAKQEGQVTWWATINAGKDIGAYTKAFSEKYPGIKIDYYEASEDVVAQKVIQEHQAGKNNVDVFVSTLYNPVKNAGVLGDLSQLVEPPAYPESTFSPAKDAAYYAYTVIILGYNTNQVKAAEAPKTWDDLLNPRWKGKIGLEAKMDAFAFGTDVPAYQGKIQGLRTEDKWLEYLAKLRAQNPHIEKGNTIIMTKLIAGEYDIAPVYLHQLIPQQKQGAPVEAASFDRAYAFPSACYVAKDAPHPNAGRLLLRWWAGPGGQAVADQIRPSGNPTAGANTIVSKYLEQKGAKVSTAGFELQTGLDQLARGYQKAMGEPVS